MIHKKLLTPGLVAALLTIALIFCFHQALDFPVT